MSDTISNQSYDAPRIEERTPLDVPLIGVTSLNADSGPSAAFRSI